MVKVKAYAKINLALNITGTKGGFHLLETLVGSIDIFDLVTVKKRKDDLVQITMHGMGSEGIPPEENNAFRVAERFAQKYRTGGVDIVIYKNIPLGAGLGGSSADAAGVLRALQKLYGIADETGIRALANASGSDTGYMLDGGYAVLTGRGDEVRPVQADISLPILLFLPETPVHTPDCYRAYDLLPHTNPYAASIAEHALESGNIPLLGENLYNALYPAASSLNGDVQIALEEAKSFSPSGAAMTGSGSGVFALFETRELCAWAQSRYKGKCRTILTRTIVPKAAKELRSPYALTEEEQGFMR